MVPAPGERIGEAELIAFCRERLAGFESPKAVVFTDGLPETVGGKVLKYKLRQQLAGLYPQAAPAPGGWVAFMIIGAAGRIHCPQNAKTTTCFRRICGKSSGCSG